jgi:hypothetical protein
MYSVFYNEKLFEKKLLNFDIASFKVVLILEHKKPK